MTTSHANPLRLENPIVLIHGLGARSSYGPFEYFWGLPRMLRRAGNRLFVPNLTAWHTIEHRAEQLKKQIEEEFPNDEKLNLVGHSMGGLDARYATAELGLGNRVASVTTIGTPNRGSAVGDIATGLMPDAAFSAIDKLLGKIDSHSGGFKQITTRHCNEVLTQKAGMVPGVAYFSATSAIRDPFHKNSLPVFWLPHKILKKLEGDNDGFVSVESAKWGEHICTYDGDHYAQIGQFLGRCRGMDYLKFYNEIFTHLHRKGL